MKIKRKDIVNLYEIISSLSEEVKNIRDVKERYKIAKNKKMLDEEINVLRETMNSNVDQDIMAFEKERMNLIQLYAEKDENGNPIVNGGMVTFSKDNREAFEKAIEELETRYPNIKERIREKNEEMEKFFEEELDVDELYKISIEKFEGSNTLTVDVINKLDEYGLIEI